MMTILVGDQSSDWTTSIAPPRVRYWPSNFSAIGLANFLYSHP